MPTLPRLGSRVRVSFSAQRLGGLVKPILLIFYVWSMIRTSAPNSSPSQGVRGCQQRSARNARAKRGLESRFPLCGLHIILPTVTTSPNIIRGLRINRILFSAPRVVPNFSYRHGRVGGSEVVGREKICRKFLFAITMLRF